jgi:hypothetical protein
MNQPSQTDVVAVLLDRHAQIRRLFTEVSQRRGEPGREAFRGGQGSLSGGRSARAT